MKNAATLLSGLLLLGLTPAAHSATIQNGSFESGFTNWVTTDLASPLNPLTVRTNGYSEGYGFFSTSATDGIKSVTHGFDGGGPGTISISQDIGTIDLSSAVLMFDYRAAWNMQDYSGSTADRVFSVVLRPNGGGAAIATFEVLRATADTMNLDTGNLTASIDLSAYVGTNARVGFEASIPQNFTGPAFMQIDNVSLAAVPEPSSTGLILTGALSALTFKRRR